MYVETLGQFFFLIDLKAYTNLSLAHHWLAAITRLHLIHFPKASQTEVISECGGILGRHIGLIPSHMVCLFILFMVWYVGYDGRWTLWSAVGNSLIVPFCCVFYVFDMLDLPIHDSLLLVDA